MSLRQKHSKKFSSSTRFFCIVDIGSVALRADVYSWDPLFQPEQCELIEKFRALPRLGQLTTDGSITSEAISVLENELKELTTKIDGLRLPNLIWKVAGTAVFREASNSEDARQLVENILGQECLVLSDLEEARYIARAILQFETDLPSAAWLVDIGGKSTELSLIKDSEVSYSTSIPIGALAIRQMFSQNVPSFEEREAALQHIRPRIKALSLPSTEHYVPSLIGSSGTIRCFQNIAFELALSNPEEKTMNASLVPHILQELTVSDPERFDELTAVEANRRDLIFSGLLVFQEIIATLEAKLIKVSRFSARHGILLSCLQASAANLRDQEISAEKLRPFSKLILH